MSNRFLMLLLVAGCAVLSFTAQAAAPVRGDVQTYSSLHGLSFGLVGGNMSYKEPGVMREDGMLYGAGVGYTTLNEDSLITYNLYGDYMGGRIIYDGATINTSTGVKTPKTDNASDWLFNLRGTVGLYREINPGVSIIPFVGLGFRMLNDKIEGAGSYNRNISYTYVPLGAQIAGWLGPSWSVSAAAEFDVVLLGTVISKLSDIDPNAPDITNHNSGTGYRLEASLRRNMGAWSMRATPFYQKWKMDQSDGVGLYIGNTLNQLYEPANENDFIGLNIGADL